MNEGATAEAKSHLERFVTLAPNSPEAATAREVLKRLVSSEATRTRRNPQTCSTSICARWSLPLKSM